MRSKIEKSAIFVKKNKSHKRLFQAVYKDFLDVADDEARTRYLHLGKVALYQMSYIRELILRRKFSKSL